MATWLGIDVGTQVIGFAVGTTLTQSARPLQSIAAQPSDQCWASISKIDREWQPEGYVVGLPLTLEGAEQPISKRARAFAEKLALHLKQPVRLIDERSSTRQAKAIFAEKRALGQSKRKTSVAVDAWAAAVILERFLLEYPNPTTASELPNATG